MKVIITRDLALKHNYDDRYNCPLFNAIRQQHPEFPLNWVGGWNVRDIHGNKHGFNSLYWNKGIYNQLYDGTIDAVQLDIELNKPNLK